MPNDKPLYNLKQIAEEIDRLKRPAVVRGKFGEKDVELEGQFNPVANTLDIGGMVLPMDIAKKWLESNYGLTEVSIEILN